MAQNQELRLQTGVSTPSSGVAKLWVNQSGVLNITNSAGTTTTVGGEKRIYRALLNQAGSGDPTATILENTLGGIPSWTYSDVGVYYATLTGSFPQGKTFLIASGPDTTTVGTIQLERINNDLLQLVTTEDGLRQNGVIKLIASSSVEIAVYP